MNQKKSFSGQIEDINGDRYWYYNGERHREDGPAIEKANGDKEWYLNGTQYSLYMYKLKTRLNK